jgi:hypothetical protein
MGLVKVKVELVEEMKVAQVQMVQLLEKE